MKKVTKILAAAVAVVLVLGGTACYFSGVPYYLKAKKHFTDGTIEWNPGPWTFDDKGTPADGKQLSFNGVSVTVPKELVENRKSPCCYSTDPDADGKYYSVFITEPEEMGELTLADLDVSAEKRFEKYLHLIGQEIPRSWCDLYMLCYELKEEDCDLHNYTNAGFFYLLEKIKEEMVFFGGEHYLIRHPGAIGIAGACSPYEDNPNYKLFVNVFDPNDKNRCNMLIVTAPELDGAYQIVNSVTLVPYTESDLVSPIPKTDSESQENS